MHMLTGGVHHSSMYTLVLLVVIQAASCMPLHIFPPQNSTPELSCDSIITARLTEHIAITLELILLIPGPTVDKGMISRDQTRPDQTRPSPVTTAGRVLIRLARSGRQTSTFGKNQPLEFSLLHCLIIAQSASQLAAKLLDRLLEAACIWHGRELLQPGSRMHTPTNLAYQAP